MVVWLKNSIIMEGIEDGFLGLGWVFELGTRTTFDLATRTAFEISPDTFNCYLRFGGINESILLICNSISLPSQV